MKTEEATDLRKKRGGFSYIEILIALSLFAIAITAVFPSLLQAARNMEVAEGYYRAHLLAQGMMLAARDALADGSSAQTAAADFAAANDMELYSIWILGQHADHFSVGDVPQTSVSLSGGVVSSVGHSTIIVIVWNESGNMAGRAVGVLYG